LIALVAGALGNKAGNGGNAWARLSWTRGLSRLGFESYFVEQLQPGAPADAVPFFASVMSDFGLARRSALLGGAGQPLWGLERAELEDVSSDAELLVNMGGHLVDHRLKSAPRLRLYLDDDPAYTQFWQAAGVPAARIEGHEVHATFGVCIGQESCPVPTGGIEWHTTFPPVVLADWPETPAAGSRFTTVGTWRGPYGRAEHGGRRYGQKVHEFRKVADLPLRVDAEFELALAIDPDETASLELLSRGGWRLVDPLVVAGSPDAFRRYVQQSRAEFSVAQGVYVETRCGWFSDRTTRYLASGRPAVVQDTGFRGLVAAGEGLLAFSTADEAVGAVNRIAADYDGHARAARELAERHFDSDVVIGGLLTRIGIGG
jgi:hypothetical protein